MTASLVVRALDGPAAGAAVPALSALVADCVAAGASVGFMAPFCAADAEPLWRAVADAVGRGEVGLLVAELDGALVGTVQLQYAMPPNQAHRADLRKLLVHPRARRRGVATTLMAAAEDAACAQGRTLLVLDTAAASEAETLYRHLGWTALGTVPDYALWPDGRFCDVVFFYKTLAPAAARASADVVVRQATEADLPGLLAIYNDAVTNSVAIWNWHETDLAGRRAWLETRRAQGYPVLVADDGGTVAGYASFGDFRPFDGFHRAVEHSIYVRADRRGHGVGHALMPPLLAAATACGKHVVIGAIAAENKGSLSFHRAHGFVETGRLPAVGWKFGRALDLVFMQKTVGVDSRG